MEGVQGLHPHAKFHCCGFKKVGLQPPKLPKFAFFWYKFAPKGKLWGSTEKLEYSCTTTNLPLCNDTIIVLKITLHHSVFVITNFFISKRDKKTDKKHHTFSSTAGTRPTIPTILGMVIEEVRPIFAPPITFLIRSVVSPLGAIEKFVGKCPHRGKMRITWVFVPRKWPN